MPSAIMAALRPTTPATILATVSAMFTTAPHIVILRMSFNLSVPFMTNLFQNLSSVILCIDLFEDLHKNSILVENEGRTESAHIFPAIQ